MSLRKKHIQEVYDTLEESYFTMVGFNVTESGSNNLLTV